jgi:hypothetical protein
MKLYIANCTNQLQTINFRVIEGDDRDEDYNGRRRRSHSTQNIGMARQEQLAGDLNRPQIDSLIKHLRAYGMHAVEDLARAYARKVYVPMLYSVDKPVSHDVWHEAMEKNKQLQKEQGTRFRREAAIATSHGMRDFSPNAADNVAVSVEEEKTGTMYHGDDQPLAEGWRMVRDV